MDRRQFVKSTAALTAVSSLPAQLGTVAANARSYPCLGRTDDYSELRIIEPGLTIARVESWTQGQYGIVRVTTNDGREGYGQLSSFEPDITATLLHRQVTQQVLGSDPAQIDALVDRVIDANMKFPWTYVCRALAGVDTAIWDLYGSRRRSRSRRRRQDARSHRGPLQTSSPTASAAARPSSLSSSRRRAAVVHVADPRDQLDGVTGEPVATLCAAAGAPSVPNCRRWSRL